MPTLTIFTPTYNRAYCLDKLYKSLINQTSKDFEWLIIDDGSTDNTKFIVNAWIDESIIPIRYFYKENGGMHTAHNYAYQRIDTEINTCIDSDDFMPNDAVSSIIECWEAVRLDHTLAGMIGLDEDLKMNIIGTTLPMDGFRCKLGSLYTKHGVTGDKKLVLRSNLTKDYPAYPEFIGEKLVPLTLLYTLINRDYDLVCFNKVWVAVDYQIDGSSSTISNQYFQSPNGFREAKIIEIKYGSGFLYIMKCIIHYGFTSIIIKDWSFYKRSPQPMLSILLFPLSYLVYLYQKQKVSNKK